MRGVARVAACSARAVNCQSEFVSARAVAMRSGTVLFFLERVQRKGSPGDASVSSVKGVL